MEPGRREAIGFILFLIRLGAVTKPYSTDFCRGVKRRGGIACFLQELSARAAAAKAMIFPAAFFVLILSMSMSKGKPSEGGQPQSEPNHQTDSLTDAPTAEAPTVEAPTIEARTS